MPIRCHTRYTRFNHDGRGNFVYLDRHQVSCGRNKMISSFRLQRDWSHRYYRYVYTCCTTPYRCLPRTFHTRFTYDGRGNGVYLDRQNVQCSYQDFITYFHLNRNSYHNKVRYTYICCNVPCGRKRSYYTYTPWNLEGHGNAVYLDRHYVRCVYGYGLSKFHLVRNGRGYYRFSIRCTKIVG